MATLDELMVGCEPGYLRLRRQAWLNNKCYFRPFFKDRESFWRGLDEAGRSSKYLSINDDWDSWHELQTTDYEYQSLETLELRKRFEAKLKSGQRYFLRECSMCHYPLAYTSVGDNLFFDAGCYCVMNPKVYECVWSELDFYFEASHGHLAAITAWVES